jgi:superfamily II DNA or RNA helicase
LQQALIAGNENNVAAILKLTQLNIALFEKNLKCQTHYGHHILHSAEKYDKNPPRFLMMISHSVKHAFGNSEGKKMLLSLINGKGRDKFRDPKAVTQIIETVFKDVETKQTDTVQKNRSFLNCSLEEGEIVDDSLATFVEKNTATSALMIVEELAEEELKSQKNSDVENKDNKPSGKIIFRGIKNKRFLFFSDKDPQKSGVAIFKLVTPFAGINNKYLDEVSMVMPAKTITVIGAESPQGNVHELIPIDLISTHSNMTQATLVDIIKLDYFTADFYSAKGIPGKSDKVTFVCAGRKEKALVPQPEKGRCVIVCTQNEFKNILIHHNVLLKTDVLVLKEINHPIINQPYNEMGKIAVRRLGIFLAASHWDLAHFMMIDDNIKSIDLKRQDISGNIWDTLFDTLEKQLGHDPCVTLTRHYSLVSAAGQLGSKLFLIDLDKIKNRLNVKGNNNLFLLFPTPKQAHCWGEDYYLQIMLYNMFQPDTQGYRIVDKEVATLIRANKLQNAFRGTGNQAILATHFDSKDAALDHWRVCDPTYSDWVKNTILIFNQIVTNNQARYNLQKEALTEKTPQVATTNPVVDDFMSRILPVRNFRGEFQKSILSTTFTINKPLREYQIDAIKACGKTKHSLAQITMATGCGKTWVQAELGRIAFDILQPGEYIIMVTGRTALVTQMHSDLIAHYQEEGIPADSIIPVSSVNGHIDIKRLHQVLAKDSQPKVLIFCEDSLKNLINDYEHFLSRVRLLLLDEYHDYSNDVIKLPKLIKDKDIFTLGCTATPPNGDPLNTIFQYSLAQGIKDKYLAPIVAESLGTNYSKNIMKDFIQALPKLLVDRKHPRYSGKTNLKSCKGIVFLPSVELCEQANEILRKNDIKSYAIHSHNTHHKKELKQFKESECGVILACQMCRFGFDDRQLAYVIIAQNTPEQSNIIQMVGRGTRKEGDKICYILTFNDICSRIKQLLPTIANPITGLFSPQSAILPRFRLTSSASIVKKVACKDTKNKELENTPSKSKKVDFDARIVEMPSMKKAETSAPM